MDRSTAINAQNYLLVVTVVTMIVVLPWEAHINSNASDLVSLSPSCFDVPRQERFSNTDMYVVIVILLSWSITEMTRFRMTRSDTCS